MKDPKIYSDCYQAVIQIFHRTKSIPKHLRPTLGRRIEDSALGCLISIRKGAIASSAQRMKHLFSASEQLDELRIMVQIAKDLNAISITAFSEITELTREIGKELGGFIKHEQRAKPTP